MALPLLWPQIISSVAEHHSSLVPWQLVAAKTGAVIKHVTLTEDTQELDMKVGACQTSSMPHAIYELAQLADCKQTMDRGASIPTCLRLRSV